MKNKFQIFLRKILLKRYQQIFKALSLSAKTPYNSLKTITLKHPIKHVSINGTLVGGAFPDDNYENEK